MNAEGTAKRLQNGYREAARGLKTLVSEKNIQSDELEAARTRNEHLKLQLIEMAERAASQEKVLAHLRSELEATRTVRLVTMDNEYPTTVAEPRMLQRCPNLNQPPTCQLACPSSQKQTRAWPRQELPSRQARS